MAMPEEKFLARLESFWLHDLDFVDLYVSLYKDLPSYYQKADPGKFNVMPHNLPPEYKADVAQLRQELEIVLSDVEETSLTYDGMRLRISKAVTTRGETWAALRRVDLFPPVLDKLGFTLPNMNTLRDIGSRDGLILICGGTGQGKTTTANAILYDYLNRYGGVAFTIEDPVEYLLDGCHGTTGLCYQVEVKEEEDWAKYLKRALRWHPRYIMVGEIRTPEAVNQLLRAANSGHLVITTMHAGSIEEGLEGLLQLARPALGDMAATLLASGLTAVLHQSFMVHSVTSRLYVTQEGNLGEPVRALVRERHIGQITTFVDQQEAKRNLAARGERKIY
jgi:twitching motility protein PilT